MHDDKVIPMTLAKCFVITRSTPTVIQTDICQPNGLKMILAMQLKKGLARDEPTFMPIPLDSLENLEETVHMDILCVLEKYRDVMPDSLPKSLSSQRMIDHEIELLSEAKNVYEECLLYGTNRGWTPECQAAFDGLKQVLMEGLILEIVNMTKPFEQARWQEFLVEFDFKFKHKKRLSNRAADALSQKNEHATMCMLAHLQTSKIDGLIRDVLREFLQKDLVAQNVMNLAKAGERRQSWV
ncbi:RNA-directed DNA polymerase-like protein [Cucumis melo var. makuwa]|uniref:RNA-directed DNA polymerase-like protein n=1 Tax=Cucumis melo var. makuwa TaxID=1194695 RepID=A0A5A7TPU9_CUCMM|nr:RNA-directed DNA polymerase-like protein [Cucumis melo var. makuwa]TYK27351.1 RNA-directed DNA polymerase-like protein [Cucumis melo var. makuwa]